MAPVKWKATDMERAIAQLRSKSMSLRQASNTYNIPIRTLRDHLTKVMKQAHRGHPPVFTAAEEQVLSKRLAKLSKMGFGLTREELRYSVYDFADLLKRANHFNKQNKAAGHRWVRNFLKRNSTITMRQSEKLNYARGQRMNKTVVRKYIDIISATMEELGITQRPELVFNADETGVQLTTNSAPKVLALKGGKRVHRQVPSEKAETVSIMCAANATGSYISPCIVYKLQRAKGAVALWHRSATWWKAHAE